MIMIPSLSLPDRVTIFRKNQNLFNKLLIIHSYFTVETLIKFLKNKKQTGAIQKKSSMKWAIFNKSDAGPKWSAILFVLITQTLYLAASKNTKVLVFLGWTQSYKLFYTIKNTIFTKPLC